MAKIILNKFRSTLKPVEIHNICVTFCNFQNLDLKKVARAVSCVPSFENENVFPDLTSKVAEKVFLFNLSFNQACVVAAV